MATGEGLGTSAAYALDPEQTPHTYLELGALPTAVPCARLHVKHVLLEWQMPELAEKFRAINPYRGSLERHRSALLTVCDEFLGKGSD